MSRGRRGRLVATEVFADPKSPTLRLAQAERYAEDMRERGFSARIFDRDIRADSVRIACKVVVVREKVKAPK